MKKLLTLALALIALAVFTGLSVGQGAQQKDKQKSPPKSAETKPAPTTPPAPTAKNSAHATEQVMTGTVTKVDEKAQTFIIKTTSGEQFTFSAKEIPPPKKDEQVDVTYIQQTPGGLLEARRYKVLMVRMQQGRAQDQDDSPKVMIGTVTEVNEKAQTFNLKTANGEQFTFTFSAKEMLQPKKGDEVAVTYDQPTPGGPMVARAPVKGSKSVNLRVVDDAHSAQQITGKVLRVNKEAKTFTIMTKGKEVTLSTEKLKGPPPEVGKIYDITYTPNPGGANWSINLNSSRSNIY
jgi:hypothetical protein